MRRTGVPDQLVLQAGQASSRLWADTAVLALRGRPPGPGDLLVLPGDADSGDVEWAVLETDERGGLRAVPADMSPLTGSADVAAPGCRVLRCALVTRLEPAMLEGARRTGVLDAATLVAARDRCRALEQGRVRGTLQALETDQDPEYRQLIRGIEVATRVLGQRQESGSAASVVSLLERPTSLRHRILPATIAAALLLTVAVLIILVQWRTIDELRRVEMSPIVDPPVVWLEPAGDRGAPDVRVIPEGARYVVLLISPELAGPAPDDYVLEILAVGRGETPLWSGELQRGQIPELFVLVPGHLLDAGEYRLELTGRRDTGEVSAGRFRMRVIERPPDSAGGA